MNTLVNVRVICAWCKAVLIRGTPGAPTSHGICPGCTEQLEAAIDDAGLRRSA